MPLDANNFVSPSNTPKPDGTEGTVSVILTLRDKPEPLELNGCIVPNDKNLKNLINDYIYIDEYQKTKFFIYFCCFHKNLKSNLEKTEINVHRFNKPDKDKNCAIPNREGSPFVHKECHVFFPACHDLLKTTDFETFLEMYSKKIPSHFVQLTNGEYKGLTRETRVQFLKMTLLSSNDNLVMKDSSLFTKLVNGPLLDSDKVVGYYFKDSDGSRLTVHMLQKDICTYIWTNSCNLQQLSGESIRTRDPPTQLSGGQDQRPQSQDPFNSGNNQPPQPPTPYTRGNNQPLLQPPTPYTWGNNQPLLQPPTPYTWGNNQPLQPLQPPTPYTWGNNQPLQPPTPYTWNRYQPPMRRWARQNQELSRHPLLPIEIIFEISTHGGQRLNFEAAYDSAISKDQEKIAQMLFTLCGAHVKSMAKTSLKIQVQVRNFDDLHNLWERYKSKELQKKFKEVILSDELMKLVPEDTEQVEVSVDIPISEYRAAQGLLSEDDFYSAPLYVPAIPLYMFVPETFRQGGQPIQNPNAY